MKELKEYFGVPTPKITSLSIPVTPDVKERVLLLAAKHNISVARLIRALVMQACDDSENEQRGGTK